MIGPATSSDEKTASSAITTRPSFLHGFEVLPPPFGSATLKVYDSENSTVAGKKLLASAVVRAGQNSVYLSLLTPRVANRGIYAVLTSTAATSFVVAYSLG